MLLSDLSNIINADKIVNLRKNKKFNRISSSSKEVNKHTVYIIYNKKKIKNEYLLEAVNKKIPAIISGKFYSNLSVTQFVVKDINKEVNKVLKSLKPEEPLNSIAITGTNGKTSVAWYISQICKFNNIQTKMQGTLGYYINNKKFKTEDLTTPLFEKLYQNGFSKKTNKYNFIFEASSHALAQDRIKKFPINIAAITNISHDHMDYHKSFLNYKNAKFKLFQKYLNVNGIAVINSRLNHFRNLLSILKNKKINYIVYGKKDIVFKKIKSHIFLRIYNYKFKLNNKNLSKIDIQNLECAIACCLQLNISPKKIYNSINKIKPPPGRSEVIDYESMCSKIIVDYAHTPDALSNILISYTFNNTKPNLVFGCGGNRDRSKRKLMGKIAFSLADQVFVTDDNPRQENAKNIRNEIIKHCPKAKEIPNRRKAIFEAINNLKKNKILIIAGKGHEKFQIIKNKNIKFDDVKVVQNYIRNN